MDDLGRMCLMKEKNLLNRWRFYANKIDSAAFSVAEIWLLPVGYLKYTNALLFGGI